MADLETTYLAQIQELERALAKLDPNPQGKSQATAQTLRREQLRLQNLLQALTLANNQ
jgi:hypothetical protein